MNFAVCVDANAGIRAQARQQKREKDEIFEQRRVDFYNSEQTFERALNNNILGYGRDLADAEAQAIYLEGKGRRALETAAREYFQAKGNINEGGRSRRYGIAAYQKMLASRAEVEGVLDTNRRRNFAYVRTGAERKFLSKNAEAREQLGLPPQYGAPVMLPPTNRLGGALSLASQALSIGTSFKTLI